MQHGKLYFLSVICKLGLGLSQAEAEAAEHVCILSSTQVRTCLSSKQEPLFGRQTGFWLVLKTKYKHVPPDSALVLVYRYQTENIIYHVA